MFLFVSFICGFSSFSSPVISKLLKARQDEENAELEGGGFGTIELPKNDVSLLRVHAILDKMSAEKDNFYKEILEDEESLDTRSEQSRNVNDAMQTTAKLWARNALSSPERDHDRRHLSLTAKPVETGTTGVKRKRKKIQDKNN